MLEYVWVVAGLGLGLLALLTYNRLVRLRNEIGNAFAQIDVQLKRRFDLIPNLVETARGYLAHERETLEAVTAARGRVATAADSARRAPADAAAITALGGAEALLGGAIGRLFAVAEAYPELKADTTMRELSDELAHTENRIAFARQAFNDGVLDFNNAVQQAPANLVARMFGFRPAAMLEATANPAERTAPAAPRAPAARTGWRRRPNCVPATDARGRGRAHSAVTAHALLRAAPAAPGEPGPPKLRAAHFEPGVESSMRTLLSFSLRRAAPLLLLGGALPLAQADVPGTETAGVPAVVRCNTTAGGNPVFAVHADKIVFRLVGGLLAAQPADQAALDAIPRQTELDIKVFDNPTRVADIRAKVLTFLGAVPNAANRSQVDVLQVTYAMVCPVKPFTPPLD
jgi:LemA protein